MGWCLYFNCCKLEVVELLHWSYSTWWSSVLTSLLPFELARHFVNLFFGRQRHRNASLAGELDPLSKEAALLHLTSTLKSHREKKIITFEVPRVHLFKNPLMLFVTFEPVHLLHESVCSTDRL